MSPYYPAMVMAEARAVLLEKWDADKLPHLLEALLREDVLLAAFQCLVRTLQRQRADGC